MLTYAVVMEDGRVAERGSHAELFAQKGSRYAAMWAAQEREVLQKGDLLKTPSLLKPGQ